MSLPKPLLVMVRVLVVVALKHLRTDMPLAATASLCTNILLISS